MTPGFSTPIPLGTDRSSCHHCLQASLLRCSPLPSSRRAEFPPPRVPRSSLGLFPDSTFLTFLQSAEAFFDVLVVGQLIHGVPIENVPPDAPAGGVSMGRWPTQGNENQRRRPRESGDPLSARWIPACAGMTHRARFSGEPQVSAGFKLSRPREGARSVSLQSDFTNLEPNQRR